MLTRVLAAWFLSTTPALAAPELRVLADPKPPAAKAPPVAVLKSAAASVTPTKAAAVPAAAATPPKPAQARTAAPATSSPGKAGAPASGTAQAPAQDPAVVALERLALSVQRVTLDNGLRVVMNVDTSSPTVAVSVTYDVGSRDETSGQSGFAHLFEHMMFKGSKNVKTGQHFALVTQRGGTLNGTTSTDRTNYFELLPSTELELALFLEADRMRWLDVNAENFENQRSVVKEEYRMRVDNAPYARASIRLDEILYADYPPYAHPTIGSMQDLDAAKLDWVTQFYQTHYVPNAAVLTIAGDFDADHALELVKKYFGAAPRRDLAPFAGKPVEAPAATHREVVEDKNASTPALFWGFRIPEARSKDHYALEIASSLLADGESSRLYQKLVRDRSLLQRVSAGTEDHRGPDAFILMGVLTEKAKVDEIERAFDAGLAELRKTAPSEAELQRAKSRLKHDFVFGLQSNARRAIRFGEYEVFFGDARLLTRELGLYLGVTAADVQRVANEYLKPERRFAVEVRPAPRAAGGAK